MRSIVATVLIVLFAAGSLSAQIHGRLMDKPVFEREATVAADGTLLPGSQERFGTMVLKSTKPHLTPWWGAWNDWSQTGVVHWGYIWKHDTNNLPDEAIDGFLFNYVTNDISPDGMTWAFFFWDQATGWNDNQKVHQWSTVFSGMPNHAASPQTWFATSWTFTFDLAGGDQSLEFLMDKGDENTKINDGVEFGFFKLSTDWVSPNPPAVPYWGFTFARPDGNKTDSNFAQGDSACDRFGWNGGDIQYLGTFFHCYTPGL